MVATVEAKAAGREKGPRNSASDRISLDVMWQRSYPTAERSDLLSPSTTTSSLVLGDDDNNKNDNNNDSPYSAHGQVIGQHHNNTLLNTLMYDIEFPNGDVRKYAANIIAVNLSAQVDREGFHTNVLEAIMDHKRDRTAVPMSRKYFKTNQGRQTQRKTTVGWALQIK